MHESMKRHFCFKFATLVIALGATGTTLAGEEAIVIRLSEPVEQTADSETFGSPLDEAVPAVSLEQIAGDGESYVGLASRANAKPGKARKITEFSGSWLDRRCSILNPASSRAPRIISPLAPAKQSK